MLSPCWWQASLEKHASTTFHGRVSSDICQLCTIHRAFNCCPQSPVLFDHKIFSHTLVGILLCLLWISQLCFDRSLLCCCVLKRPVLHRVLRVVDFRLSSVPCLHPEVWLHTFLRSACVMWCSYLYLITGMVQDFVPFSQCCSTHRQPPGSPSSEGLWHSKPVSLYLGWCMVLDMLFTPTGSLASSVFPAQNSYAVMANAWPLNYNQSGGKLWLSVCRYTGRMQNYTKLSPEAHLHLFSGCFL